MSDLIEEQDVEKTSQQSAMSFCKFSGNLCRVPCVGGCDQERPEIKKERDTLMKDHCIYRKSPQRD